CNARARALFRLGLLPLGQGVLEARINWCPCAPCPAAVISRSLGAQARRGRGLDARSASSRAISPQTLSRTASSSSVPSPSSYKGLPCLRVGRGGGGGSPGGRRLEAASMLSSLLSGIGSLTANTAVSGNGPTA